jgi:hypothetical protein
MSIRPPFFSEMNFRIASHTRFRSPAFTTPIDAR